MSNEKHLELGKKFFNATWDLIDKTDRSDLDNLEMISLAHKSLYHWSFVGEPVNFARGEWQISRVFALINMGEAAMYHAKRSLSICLENNIGDFDLVFAYEAVARAANIVGKKNQALENISKALELAENISDEGNKNYALSEVNSIKID